MRMRTTIGLSLALLVGSSAAMAQQNQPTHHQPAPSVKSKPEKNATVATRAPGQQHSAHGKPAARSVRHQRGQTRHRVAALPPADQYIGPVRVIGQRVVGAAAWYGGRHLGRLTASGERLDAVRATAAHRTLPLHSLARVTNLNNGRSVILKITDRGPVSRSLQIDLSPRAAQELDMINAGIAQVAIEPVAPAGGEVIAEAR